MESNKLQQLYQPTSNQDGSTRQQSTVESPHQHSPRRSTRQLPSQQSPRQTSSPRSSEQQSSPSKRKQRPSDQQKQIPKRTRSSGLWGAIMDTFVTPTKTLVFGKSK